MDYSNPQLKESAWPRPRKMSRALRVLTLMLLATLQAAAEQPNPRTNSEHELVQQLLARVQELEAQVREMKARQSDALLPDPLTPEPRSPQNAREQKEENEGKPAPPTQGQEGKVIEAEAQEPSVEMPPQGPNLQIRGFGDFGFHVTDQRGDTNSFSLNQFDLFLKSRLTDKFSVSGDIIIDTFKNGFEIDLERLVLQYAAHDRLNVSFGRFLTGIGYYNTAFQHANWFQTTIGRPFIFEFDDHGGVLPIHTVGFTANGLIPSGRLGLHYLAEVGNGESLRGEPVQNFMDENNRKAVNLGLYIRPDWLSGLQAGFTVYRDRLVPEDLPKINQTITALYVVYVKPNFEFLSEGIFIRHAAVGGSRVFTAPAFYIQISRRFFGRYRPYFRYEYLNVPATMPIFGEVGRRNAPVGGVRIELNDYAALKVQFDHQARRDIDAFNRLSVHFTFTF